MPMLQKLGNSPDRGRRPRRLRAHLTTVFLIAMAPLFAFAVYMIYRSAVEEQRTLQRGAAERVRAIKTALDSELESSINTLQALATSPNLDRGDLAAFYEEAGRILKSQSDWLTIIVIDVNGDQLVNLQRPFGSPLPHVADQQSFDEVMRTAKPAVGFLVRGPILTTFNFPVRVPVVRSGAIKYVLTAGIPPQTIQALLAQQKLPSDWVAAVIDARQTIVARSVDPERMIGQTASETLRAALAQSPAGWFRGTTLEGRSVYTAYDRSEFSGWTVAMGIPAAVVDAPLRSSLAYTALVGLGLVILGLVLALLFSRRTTESIEALSELAGDLAAGSLGEPPAIPAHVAEVAALRDAFLSARQQIEQRGKERDAFERELWQQASLLELTHDAIFVFEFPQRNIVYWNRGAEMLYGYAKAEAIGKTPRELLKTYHPRGVDFVNAALEENGEWSGELVHIARDGREVFVDSRHVLVAPTEGRRLVLESNRDATERRREERRREGRAAINAILAEARTLRAAAPRIAEALGTLGGWDMCNIWQWDRAAGEFVCVEVWHPSDVEVGVLETVTRGRRAKLPRRIGLLGRVLKSGEPTWIADVATDSGYYARAEAARQSGMHAAFCFPIKLAAEVLGFVECYSREVRTPDPDFVRTLAAIGMQLGHFIERTRVEEDIEWLSSIATENPAPMLRLTEAHIIAFANPAALPVLRGWHTDVGDKPPEAIVSMARAALAAGEKRVVAIALNGARYNVAFVPVAYGNYVNLYFSEMPAAAPRA
jgi:PAS domain S-box-containing protein